jgi:hypothetical protein
VPDYLTKRNGFWQFVRRVPLEFAHLDQRGVVKHSTRVEVLKDRRGTKAGKIADAMNRELEAYWRGLSEGKGQEAADRYAEARRRARTPGFDYADTAELINRSILEVLERLKLVTAGLVEDAGARAAPDDDAAIKRAQQLPESRDVELWRGGRFIVKLTTPKK